MLLHVLPRRPSRQLGITLETSYQSRSKDHHAPFDEDRLQRVRTIAKKSGARKKQSSRPGSWTWAMEHPHRAKQADQPINPAQIRVEISLHMPQRRETLHMGTGPRCEVRVGSRALLWRISSPGMHDKPYAGGPLVDPAITSSTSPLEQTLEACTVQRLQARDGTYGNKCVNGWIQVERSGIDC